MDILNDLKKNMAEMFGISVEELGDPFASNNPLPKPEKYLCSIHKIWWYPDNNVCCPECYKESK